MKPREYPLRCSEKNKERKTCRYADTPQTLTHGTPMKKLLERLCDPFVRLFWMLQIGIMNACPPLQSLVLNLGVNSERSAKLWLKLFFQVLVRLPVVLFQHLHDLKNKRVVLPRVALGVTSRCTLNCDKCMVRIPDLEVREDVPVDEILKSLDTLFACVDQIYVLCLSGGEAFLHPDLDKIVLYAMNSDKVGKVDVSTNGTLIPNEKTLNALRDADCTVRITAYAPELQPNVEKLKAALKEKGIHYIHASGDYWYDFDRIPKKQKQLAKRRYNICAQRMCLVFFRGKLHLCTPALALNVGEIIPDCKTDYIDLNSPMTYEEFRIQWSMLRNWQPISACDYCLGSSYDTPRVPVAVQRTRNKGEEKYEEIT